MSGRHRKPTNTSRRLAKAGVLTIMVTAPLGLVGSAMASPVSVPDKHSKPTTAHRWSDDSDDFDDDTDDSGSVTDLDYSSDSDDGDYADDYAEPSRWSHETHAARRRAAEHRSEHSQGHRSESSASARHSSAAQSAVARSSSWDRLARCESTENWDANTGNGYKGGLQFSDATWRAYGGGAYARSADKASREQQIKVAKKVQQAQGWQAWPSCSRKLGLNT
jgi:hypothetical protein